MTRTVRVQTVWRSTRELAIRVDGVGHTGPDRDHNDAACEFTLALSGEHTGFTFERDLAKAENMIRLHSGGENAVALRALRGGASGTLAGRGDARELLEMMWRRATA